MLLIPVFIVLALLAIVLASLLSLAGGAAIDLNSWLGAVSLVLLGLAVTFGAALTHAEDSGDMAASEET